MCTCRPEQQAPEASRLRLQLDRDSPSEGEARQKDKKIEDDWTVFLEIKII